MEEGDSHRILGGKIIVRKFHNDGIALGYFSDCKEKVKKSTLVMMGGALLYFLILLCRRGNAIRKAGMAVFLGGAMCNWFDRFHQKTVTDYFSFNVKWKKLKNIVFNLSDFCIIVGLILALLGGGKARR